MFTDHCKDLEAWTLHLRGCGHLGVDFCCDGSCEDVWSVVGCTRCSRGGRGCVSQPLRHLKDLR